MDELTEFYYALYPHVYENMQKEGIDPRWASIVTPQMMIESNWGRDTLAQYNNFSGMKAGKDQKGIVLKTKEGYGNNEKVIEDKFLTFPSVEEGVRKQVLRLRDKFHAFEGEPSPEQYIQNINSNPKQVYFTGDPERYQKNIDSIKNGERAKAAVAQYRKDKRQQQENTINREINARLAAQPNTVNVVKPTVIHTPRTAEDTYKAMQKVGDYHKFMDSISIQNNPRPQFVPKYSDGGQIDNPWNSLSIKEKSDIINVAVRNGITTLPEIKERYNEFAKGGDISDENYYEPIEDTSEENIFDRGGKKQVFLSSLDQSLKEDGRFNNVQWRQFFTDLANQESGYRSDVTNSIGAKGYFQLMPFNRAKSWNSPTQQFHEMYKLTNNNLNYLNKNLTKKDWEKADALGIDMYGMLAGAHLGGAGNVLKALRGKGNAKDMNGTSVMKYMTKFSQKGSVPTLATSTYYEDTPTALFTPSNPEVFFGGYKAPEIEAPLPSVELDDAPQYSEEEVARQERREKLNNLSMLMNLTSPQGSSNSMLDTLSLLMG